MSSRPGPTHTKDRIPADYPMCITTCQAPTQQPPPASFLLHRISVRQQCTGGMCSVGSGHHCKEARGIWKKIDCGQEVRLPHICASLVVCAPGILPPKDSKCGQNGRRLRACDTDTGPHAAGRTAIVPSGHFWQRASLSRSQAACRSTPVQRDVRRGNTMYRLQQSSPAISADARYTGALSRCRHRYMQR